VNALPFSTPSERAVALDEAAERLKEAKVERNGVVERHIDRIYECGRRWIGRLRPGVEFDPLWSVVAVP
jgi:hypothetical protein